MLYRLYDNVNDDLIYRGNSKCELKRAFKEYTELCDGDWIPVCLVNETISSKAKHTNKDYTFYVRGSNKKLLYKGKNLKEAKQIAEDNNIDKFTGVRLIQVM